MEERQVTVERSAYRLPPDFLVIATQNPRDFEGTYPLPESQLDRFMLRIDMRYPAREDELAILSQYGGVNPASVNRGEPLASALLADARASVEAVHVAPELYSYVLELANATRQDAQIALGLSTRGVLALLRAARITAGLRGSTFATPDDVKEMVPFVVPHRLVLAPEALLEGVTEQTVTRKMLERVPVPR
jgi:MoxR-like ATPase